MNLGLMKFMEFMNLELDNSLTWGIMNFPVLYIAIFFCQFSLL